MRTVAPALTSMRSGVKRMASVMSTSMVRVARAASPGLPMGVDAAGMDMPWPACSPAACAAPATSRASAAAWVKRIRVSFTRILGKGGS
ncbi:hypothetical protein G6F24_018106 [Rhizopus arrhizus]|nr:hypothetical protein G6F24_018106 [Rhizopus arrhizus]